MDTKDRYVAGGPPGASSAVLGIGFLMIAFHPRKRGLHVIIAGTLVVHR